MFKKLNINLRATMCTPIMDQIDIKHGKEVVEKIKLLSDIKLDCLGIFELRYYDLIVIIVKKT